MSTLPYEHTQFDILFRNFFKADEAFAPALNSKQPHPLNIFYDDQGLHFEIACTGLTKDDIYHGLSKKSFSLGYKISPKFNMDLVEAKLEHGLLNIFIPLVEEAKKKIVKIK